MYTKQNNSSQNLNSVKVQSARFNTTVKGQYQYFLSAYNVHPPTHPLPPHTHTMQTAERCVLDIRSKCFSNRSLLNFVFNEDSY